MPKDLYDVYFFIGNFCCYWLSNWWGKEAAVRWTQQDKQRKYLQRYQRQFPNDNVRYEILKQE